MEILDEKEALHATVGHISQTYQNVLQGDWKANANLIEYRDERNGFFFGGGVSGRYHHSENPSGKPSFVVHLQLLILLPTHQYRKWPLKNKMKIKYDLRCYICIWFWIDGRQHTFTNWIHEKVHQIYSTSTNLLHRPNIQILNKQWCGEGCRPRLCSRYNLAVALKA